MKKFLLIWLLIIPSLFTIAQNAKIQGYITNPDGTPAVGAVVILNDKNISVNPTSALKVQTDEKGFYIFENIKAGDYQIVVVLENHDNYFSEKITVTENQITKIDPIKLTASATTQNNEGTAIVNSDDLNNELGSENISPLLSGSRDVFLNTASFSLSSFRFKIRGYESEYTDILINGVNMSNLETGGTYFSNWGGLNAATKNKSVTFGLDPMHLNFGNVGGTTNIELGPSKIRKGLQLTYSMTNRTYRQRAMITYSTGLLPNNWGFSFAGARRWANEGYIEGTYYDSWSYYMGIEKKIQNHHIILNVFGAPTKIGKSGPSTQEMYDIVGNNFYNPYWGYQNGEKRNSRVSNTHEPIAILTHTWEINESTKLTTSALYRTGRNGSTALNWYNAPDPRPDYYRNLPSYITNEEEADYQEYALMNDSDYNQINWAYLYETNRNSFATIENVDGVAGSNVSGTMAQYIVEERRYDQNFYTANTTLNKQFTDDIRLDFGLNYRNFTAKNFKVVNDLLGADFWYDVDKYAETDFADPDSAQSNLLEPNNVVYVNDVFGYNYNAHITDGKAWTQIYFDTKRINFFIAGFGSYTEMWREGLMQNGKFPDNSYGDSEHLTFIDYGAKTGLVFKINGRNYIHGHAAYLTQAPTFRNSYISPRTRDNVVSNLVSEKIMSADIGYSLKAPKIKATFNAFYTTFEGQTKIMSFYHDSYRNFVNYAMNGINKTHQGLEFAIDGQLFIGFNAYAVASLGYYRYTSRPEVSITVDNSAELLTENKIVYCQNFLVSGTPQTAGTVGIKYRTGSFWFFDVSANYVDDIYLDFNPERRTAEAIEYINPETESDLWHQIVDQEKLPSGYTLNATIGKSFRFQYKYFLNLNLSVSNILDNQNIITGGFEQLRYEYKNPAKYPPKYFYMYGRQFFLNIGFRF